MRDEKWMLRAISLGERGRITAPPNPWVGCVIVKEDKVIGEGYHRRAGEAHAEVAALKQAGSTAEGASVYVTLEPCCHFGSTPPCVDALIAAKIAHVYIAVIDPDSRVSGQGIAALKNAGIGVTAAVCHEEAIASLEPYLHHRKTGLPFCIAKIAASLDGRTAALDHTSKWITTEGAKRDSHRIRAESQAIIVGSQTARIDHPHLTVRGIHPAPPKPPLKVVISASGREVEGYDLLFTCLPVIGGIQVSRSKEGVNLKEVLEVLGKKGVMQVMIEGGPTLLGSFLKASLIDKLIVYIGPRLLGHQGAALFYGMDIPTIEKAPTLRLLDVKQIEESVRLTYSSL